MVTLIGGGLAMPIDRHLYRYRITWRFVGSPVLPNAGYDSYNVAVALRENLPSNGMVAVSNVAAQQGDPFIQFTVQLTQSFPGYTLGDVVRYANKLPLFSVSSMSSLQLALDVSEVEVRAAGLPSAIVLAQDDVSRARAIAVADEAEVTTQIGNAAGAAGGAITDAAKSFGDKLDEYLKKTFGGLADLVKFTVGVAGLIGVTYVIVRYRK